jgi:hypothetical protein
MDATSMDLVTGSLGHLARIRDARSARASSWDQTGRNQDGWVIGPGESRVIADLEGPGCIKHIWMSLFCQRPLGPTLVPPELTEELAPILDMNNALGLQWEIRDPDLYRKVLLRITWDEQPHPSILVPLGDFFGIGHSLPAAYASLPFVVSVRSEEAFKFGGNAGLNCYLPMPFGGRALMEVVNENDLPCGLYFHVDYELYRQPLSSDVGYLHAQWRRENPCEGWAPDIQVNSPEVNIPNLDGVGNYTILDVIGTGHYVGCNLSVFHRQGTWWGEGDDMMFVDGEEWPPSIHGTGGEDYFGHAWGMQPVAFPMCGSIVHESQVPGYQVSYRFHLVDPVHFSQSLRVTMEHGHANHLSDDWSSTAYWYQSLPSRPFGIPPVSERLPHRPEAAGPRPPATTPHGDLSRVAEERRRLWLSRFEAYLADRRRSNDRRAEESRLRATHNVRFAADLRRRYLDHTPLASDEDEGGA